jgi:hypothetical protein
MLCADKSTASAASGVSAASGGIVDGAREKIAEHLRLASTATLNSLVVLLNGYSQLVQMANVGRDGGPTDDGSIGVSPGDAGAFQFLLLLCQWVPAALCPVLPCLYNPTQFRVLHGPLFWWLRETWILPSILLVVNACCRSDLTVLLVTETEREGDENGR